MEKKRTRHALIAVGLAGIAGSAGNAAWAYSQVAPTRAWPSVEGRVVDARVAFVARRGRNNHQSISYTPSIRYSYTVGGRSFESDRVYPAEPQYWRDDYDLRLFLQNYPTGRALPVFYNPAAPGESALILEVNYTTAIVLLVLGILSGFAGLAVRGGPRKAAA
jgi:hypothetical protein